MEGFLQKLRGTEQIEIESFATRFVVGSAGDLDEATPHKTIAVSGVNIAEISPPFVA